MPVPHPPTKSPDPATTTSKMRTQYVASTSEAPHVERPDTNGQVARLRTGGFLASAAQFPVDAFGDGPTITSRKRTRGPNVDSEAAQRSMKRQKLDDALVQDFADMTKDAGDEQDAATARVPAAQHEIKPHSRSDLLTEDYVEESHPSMTPECEGFRGFEEEAMFQASQGNYDEVELMLRKHNEHLMLERRVNMRDNQYVQPDKQIDDGPRKSASPQLKPNKASDTVDKPKAPTRRGQKRPAQAAVPSSASIRTSRRALNKDNKKPMQSASQLRQVTTADFNGAASDSVAIEEGHDVRANEVVKENKPATISKQSKQPRSTAKKQTTSYKAGHPTVPKINPPVTRPPVRPQLPSITTSTKANKPRLTILPPWSPAETALAMKLYNEGLRDEDLSVVWNDEFESKTLRRKKDAIIRRAQADSGKN